MTDAEKPVVAVFRPNDDRLDEAVSVLDGLGAVTVTDPMLAVDPTGRCPREDAEYTVLTSKTGAERVAAVGWEPDGTVVAIGPATADALRTVGYRVDLVPAEYSSVGIVEALSDRVDGHRVEVARSDHGTEELLDGLESAGAYIHETVLYRLVRPESAGESAELAAAGDLDAAVFTSSLTVSNFLEVAEERGVRQAAREGLSEAVVGAIGEPTRRTATEAGVVVDVVPEEATFEALATATVGRL